MAKRQKYYVVWKGREPGVYSNWEDCQVQIAGFPGAEYKSFARKDEALEAFAGDYAEYRGSDTKTVRLTPAEWQAKGVILDSISVDAACSGNPGVLEYQGVETETGQRLFHKGPFQYGTINIGEFLAIVHALAMLKQEGRTCPIYSDSRIAIGWVQRRVLRTRLTQTKANARLFALADRGLKWLKENPVHVPLLKWDTKQWGENPADFGRK